VPLPYRKYYRQTKTINEKNTTTSTLSLQPKANYEVDSLRSKILLYDLNRIPPQLPILIHVFCQTDNSQVLSNHSFKLFFGRPLPLLPPRMLIISHFLTGAFILLLFTWPNHGSLVFLILSSMGDVLTRSLITPFLILSILV